MEGLWERKESVVALRRKKTDQVPAVSAKAALSPAPALATSSPAPKREPTKEEIAREAYFLWLKRGCKHGDDWKDWLEAERILRERYRSQ